MYSVQAGLYNNAHAPHLTVVTLCLNDLTGLRRTVASVYSLQDCDWEQIIVDGGSTDGSLEEALDIAQRSNGRIRLLRQHGKGIAAAFNEGVAAARGTTVGFLNSGDCYYPYSAVTAIKKLEEGYQFVFGALLYFDSVLQPLYRINGSKDFEKKIRSGFPAINHPALFVRRTVCLAAGGYHTGFRLSMDHEFVLRMVQQGVRGCAVPQVLAAMQTGGRSDRNRSKALFECRRAAVMHGASRFKSCLKLWAALLKSGGRRLLDLILPRRLAFSLRRLINPRYLPLQPDQQLLPRSCCMSDENMDKKKGGPSC